jgi:hypothetical protein
MNSEKPRSEELPLSPSCPYSLYLEHRDGRKLVYFMMEAAKDVPYRPALGYAFTVAFVLSHMSLLKSHIASQAE